MAEAHPSRRVVAPTVAGAQVTLRGNVHPLTHLGLDLGESAPGQATGRLLLLLRRSPTQQYALQRYLAAAVTPGAPEYHQWLTPAEFGAHFGVADDDLQAVQSWLEANGLRVESVPAARNRIVFSGTLGALGTAFHTSVHTFLFAGELHRAIVSDPAIPAALAPVIAGVGPLHDVRPKPMHAAPTRGVWDADAHRVRPALSVTSGSTNYLFVDPADAATLYDTPSPLNIHAGTGAPTYDGTGVTLGLLGYSDFNSQDVLNYRTAFLNDANASHLPQTTYDAGNDPGPLPGDYALEALLDNEIAGGLATGATLHYYVGASSGLDDGLTLAALDALEANAVDILSVSYASCEPSLGAAGNAQWAEFWEQAAAQGITVLVAAGDSGAADCALSTASQSTGGLSVNGLASTPYNMAVGGTDFPVLASSFNQYVNPANTNGPGYEAANGYIPEAVWNDSIASPGPLAESTPFVSSAGETDVVAGGGGASAMAFCGAGLGSDGTCKGALTGYSKPAFQAGLTPADAVRDLPDLALLAGNARYGAAWVLCADSYSNGDGGPNAPSYDCQIAGSSFAAHATFEGVGGTSAAAPALAGMLALLTQARRAADGDSTERLGQAANVIYNLAGSHPALFHDVTESNNAVACESGSPACESNGLLTGYNAGSGYDQASGLGSVDLSALVASWAEADFAATSTTLTAGTTAGSQGTGALTVTHGTRLFFNIGVSAGSSQGAPTGDVSITNNNSTGEPQASFADRVTLAPGNSGAAALASNDLPGGSYQVEAYYAGDVDHAASRSNQIALTVNAEASTTGLSLRAVDPGSGAVLTGRSLPYGTYTLATATPGSLSGSDDGVGTGGVVLHAGGSGVADSSEQLSAAGSAAFPLTAYAPGSYSLVASYAGDASFAPSNSAALPLTITPGATQVAGTAASSTIAASGTASITVTVSTDSLALAPTAAGGALTLSGNGQSFAPSATHTGADPKTGVRSLLATFSVPGAQLARGSNSLAFVYKGDANYAASSGSVTVMVQGAGAQPTISLSPSSITITPSGSVTLTGEAAGPSGSAIPTGTLTLTGNGASFAATGVVSGTRANGVTYLDALFQVSGAELAPGANNLTLGYAGDANYSAASTTATVTVAAAGDFSLSTHGSITIPQPGASGAITLTVAPVNSFAGEVSLACTVSPAGSAGTAPTCQVPAVADLSSGAALVVVNVGTTAPQSTWLPLLQRLRPWSTGGGFALCGLVLLGGGSLPRRRGWATLCFGALLCAGAALASGCGTQTDLGGGAASGTAPGTYTVTVTGTSGALTHTDAIQVLVQ